MDRPPNVATPATAATVLVPERVPLPALVPKSIVTELVSPTTTWSRTLRTSTLMSARVAPPVVPTGWTEKARWVGTVSTAMPDWVPVIDPVTVSVAVMVRPVPTVLRVTAKVPTPLVRVPLEGSVAAPSELVIATVPA